MWRFFCSVKNEENANITVPSGVVQTIQIQIYHIITYLIQLYVKDPHFSPILTKDLSRLPQAVVIVAGHDPLRDEGIEYAERLKEAGVDVELQNYEGMVHGFLSFADAVDQGMKGIGHVSKALRNAFATA